MLLKIALICLVLLTIFAVGYLAACGAAERWLTFREWWGKQPEPSRRTTCPTGTRCYRRCREGDLRCDWEWDGAVFSPPTRAAPSAAAQSTKGGGDGR